MADEQQDKQRDGTTDASRKESRQAGPRETAAGLQRGGEDPTQPAAHQGEQDKAVDMHKNDTTQDESSARAKASRHGQVTADKWNQ